MLHIRDSEEIIWFFRLLDEVDVDFKKNLITVGFEPTPTMLITTWTWRLRPLGQVTVDFMNLRNNYKMQFLIFCENKE